MEQPSRSRVQLFAHGMKAVLFSNPPNCAFSVKSLCNIPESSIFHPAIPSLATRGPVFYATRTSRLDSHQLQNDSADTACDDPNPPARLVSPVELRLRKIPAKDFTGKRSWNLFDKDDTSSQLFV